MNVSKQSQQRHWQQVCRVSGDSTGIKLSSDRGNAPAHLSGPGQASLTLELSAAGHSLHTRTTSSNFRLWPRCPTSVAPSSSTTALANKHGHTPFLNLSCFQTPVLSSYQTHHIMNGHFAAVGDEPAAEQYDHGVQVIDEDKQYKYVPPLFSAAPHRPRPPGF